MIKWGYRPQANFEKESDRVFLTFSVYPQQVCDVQPGWFLWGETSPGSKQQPVKTHDVILSALQSGRDKLNIYP